MDFIQIILSIVNWLGLTDGSTLLIIIALYLLLKQEFTNAITNAISPLEKAIIEMQSIFRNMGANIVYNLTQRSESPLKPTEFGWRLIRESGLDKIIQENKDKLFKALEKRLTPSYPAYDIQEESVGVLLDCSKDPMINPIKEYAYESGMTIESILRTGSLLLRDEYLRDNPRFRSLKLI